MRLLACLFALLLPKCALAATLLFTIPSTGQDRSMIWDPDAGDSVLHVDCTGTAAIHDSILVRLYGQPVTGGGFRVIDSHWAVDRFGAADSFATPWPGNFYVTTANHVGESCASAVVTILPSDLTAVEPTADSDPIVSCRLFNVRGALVAWLPRTAWSERILRVALPSGIYWIKAITASRHALVRRILVLR